MEELGNAVGGPPALLLAELLLDSFEEGKAFILLPRRGLGSHSGRRPFNRPPTRCRSGSRKRSERRTRSRAAATEASTSGS